MDSGSGQTETRPLTAEEEALKRNTDCVYFLASPLTCKKGNECEYRHSEVARLNPRDCYYWMKSNCLNPKCAFRHPPLVPPSPGSGPALLPTPTVVSKQIPMAQSPAYNFNKQSRSEPCIFFQKGLCLKGEWCPFSHGPQASGNAVQQQVAKASPSLPEQPQAFKKESFGIKPCANQQNMPKVSADIAFGAPVSAAKPATRAELPPSNGSSHAKNVLPHSLGNKLPKAQSAHPPVTNSNAWSRAPNHQIHPSDEHLQNCVEPGEIVGEHSSGLDAHVAYNVKGSGYFHDGDDFGRKSALGVRKLDPFSNYDHHPSDYKPAAVYERNQFSGSVDEFERNGRAQDYYDMKPHRISSERERALPLPDRRVVPRHKSPDEVDRADLRHRLKQRKIDGSRSTISPERCEPYRRDDRYAEDKYRGHHSHRDQLQVPLESSISARLWGRISLPGTSSGPSFHLQSKKERDMPRHRGRLSPTRPISNQGRQYDRTRLSEEPPLGANARNLGGRLSKREDVDSLNFSGPRSLAELKGAKLGESSQEQSTKNNVMVGKASSYQEPEDSPSFEGPKPLSVLLKRKREEAPEVNSSGGDESNQRNGGAEVCDSVPATGDEVQLGSEDSNKEDSDTVSNFGATKVETVEKEEDSSPSREDDLDYDGQSSAKEDTLETEEYMEPDDAVEDQEMQNYDQGDGEYDYRATETGDFKTECESQGEEEDELDDEEDFARKAGLMFS